MHITRTPADSIVIRHATDADICTLANLAIVDSREPLAGPVLIAEVDGVVRVALDIGDGSVAADPFVPTAHIVELLRLHARGTQRSGRARNSLRARVISLIHPLSLRA